MLATLLLQGIFTIVELNAENLFDCVHDSLKQDYDFLPTSAYKWTHTGYCGKHRQHCKAIARPGGSL